MEAHVKWLENLTFTGTSGSGHGVVMDGNRDTGFGPSPMEMLLLGLAGCSSIDVVHILQKGREKSRCQSRTCGNRPQGLHENPPAFQGQG